MACRAPRPPASPPQQSRAPRRSPRSSRGVGARADSGGGSPMPSPSATASGRPNGRDRSEESLEGPGDVPGSWVSIAEAGRRLGVSPRAVRLRIDRRQIRWRPIGNAAPPRRDRRPPGRAKLRGPPSATAAGGVGGAAAAVRPAGTRDSPGLPGTEALPRARVEELLERAARAEGELVARDALLAMKE